MHNGSRPEVILTIHLSSSTGNFRDHCSHVKSVMPGVSDRISIFHYSFCWTEWFTGFPSLFTIHELEVLILPSFLFILLWTQLPIACRPLVSKLWGTMKEMLLFFDLLLFHKQAQCNNVTLSTCPTSYKNFLWRSSSHQSQLLKTFHPLCWCTPSFIYVSAHFCSPIFGHNWRHGHRRILLPSIHLILQS